MAEPPKNWAERIRAGDRRAVARAISAIEREEQAAVPLLKSLFRSGGDALVVGLTGPPGAGKSTLLEKLAVGCRRRDQKVGILAVDPTSPFSGGALLGDRIRLQALSTDNGVYIRSMATRGRLGGIAAATGGAVTVLAVAGCDTVFVETVGVGQGEVDIALMSDITIVILAPGMGDDVQALKAGILEIADLFVVNKADHPGADRLEHELRSMIALAPRTGGWTPPVLRTVATTGSGVEGVEKALDDFRGCCENQSVRGQRQREKWRRWLHDALRQRLFERLIEECRLDGLIDAQIERIAKREQDPYSAAEELAKCFSNRPLNH